MGKIKIKRRQKICIGGRSSSLPSLVKATRIQEKAKGIGFEWSDKKDVWKKVQEELEELQAEVIQDSDEKEAEFGDVLFSLVNYARYIGVSPESALAKTNAKFIKRFQLMEKLIQEDKQEIQDMNLAEMDLYWEKAKISIQTKQQL